MATIFEKLSASGERCLILENQESFVYPFDIGNWSNLRVGAFISFTSNGNSNSGYTNESVNYTISSNKKGLFFFGLSDADFPKNFNTGSFIGGLTFGSDGTTNLNTAGFFSSSPGSIVHGAFHTGRISAGNDLGFLGNTSSSVLASGDSSYAGFLGLAINSSNKGISGQSFEITYLNSSIGAGYNDVSISKLRNFLNSAPTSSSSSVIFFNSGFSSSGGPLPSPDNFFCYFPFLNNRARIHSVLIEKY